MDELIELLKKKKKSGEKLDPTYKDAKTDVLKQILGLASDEMSSDLKGLKKVTVASDNPEGLKEGLEKAKEMLSPEAKEEAAEEKEESAEEEAKEEKSELPLSQEEMALLKKLLDKMK